jgi:hypothetical protein
MILLPQINYLSKKVYRPMKAPVLILLILSLQTLSGCSAENSLASKAVPPHAAALSIDPSIPTVTITARRMTPSEKLAYDQSQSTTLAALKTVE